MVRRWHYGLQQGVGLAVSLLLATALFAAKPEPEKIPTPEWNPTDANPVIDQYDVSDPTSAQFDSWESVFEEHPGSTLQMGEPYSEEELLTFDWLRLAGLRHSSTDGRHIGRGIPLEGASWLNRPYHADWFAGPLLSDDLIENRVHQDNELFGGIRFGWDFDYFWGVECRFGWSNPNVQYNEPQAVADNGSYFVSDVDFIYYPWGDSKIRPYYLLGLGLAHIDFVDHENHNFNTTLLTMPLGIGVRFHQWSWLAWRLEFLDNLSYGADGVETMHNLSLTAGMELRLGARPNSYWPWRSSRKIW